MLRCWSDEKGFKNDEQRIDKSRGGGWLGKIGSEIGGDKIGGNAIGSDIASSAQLRDVGGEGVQMGLGIGLGCGNVCELASRVLTAVVATEWGGMFSV